MEEVEIEEIYELEKWNKRGKLRVCIIQEVYKLYVPQIHLDKNASRLFFVCGVSYGVRLQYVSMMNDIMLVQETNS